ncbi:hypothetical protein [Stenotrophomonas sp. MMGLT7]|uniref:M949_RS01915 family surface polysaccharide biosynthesis protein n=1 Tax=Stenotrophomonas sp. MMGLT7 TaxID=2901227 RepID=UPI001E6442A8|nr:hypothetical protein [Stenotrophomonas sp. MMGLT7]MCD7099389.1 hypothetical protein [Stenotrophomonas sp. MMGLT7]
MALLVSGLAGCDGNALAEVTSVPAPTANGTLEAMPQLHLLPDLPVLETSRLKHGSLLKQLHFQDKDGEAVVLLSRESGVMKGKDVEDDSEQVVLRAALYRRVNAGAPFEMAWQREQSVECQGLDLDVGYFLNQVQATDLDRDGRAEITLASHNSCGGGVDPQQLKIELLQGRQRYAIDGESLIEIDGDTPFGGERSDSDNLAGAPAVFRAHLNQVWEQVKRMPRSD